MKRLLCSCPSRGRPKLLKEMLESFRKTSSIGTDLVVGLDDDDISLKEYNDILYTKFQYYILPRQNVAQIHNLIVSENKEYDFYMAINDDIEFVTPGWDKILMNAINAKGRGWGISFPNDTTGNHKYNLPTFGMMSKRMVNSLGYFYPPELKMLNGDIYLLDIGRAIGKLYYEPSVIIKHKPPGVASGAFVPGDVRAVNDFARIEQQAYADYVDNRLDNDVDKLLEAISNESIGVKI